MALTSAEMQVKVDKAVVNMDRLNSIVNDADTVEVPVDVGTVPTIKKFFKTHGVITPLTITASTANSATVTEPDNFIAGKMYSLKPTISNTGSYTLTVGTTPYSVKNPDGTDIVAEDFQADAYAILVFNGTEFHLLYGYSDINAIKIQAETARDEAVAAANAAVIPSQGVDRTEMKALDTSTVKVAFLKENGREGWFKWMLGDYSAQITADTAEGIYIKADAIAATVGAWVRQYTGRPAVEWFGAVSYSADEQTAIGRSAVASHTAFQAALDLVHELGGGTVEAMGQFYTWDAGVRPKSGTGFVGAGHGAFAPNFPTEPKTWEGTNILLRGPSFPKETLEFGVTSMKKAGGWIADPDDALRVFKLSSLSNDDASGSTPATTKQLGIGLMNAEHDAPMMCSGFRICPWIGDDGYSDYSLTTGSDLGDDIDACLVINDVEQGSFEDIQVRGYARAFGTLLLSAGYSREGRCEGNILRKVSSQGFVGIAIRAGDIYPVVALTATTLEIPWTEESYWPASGAFEGLQNGTDYTYTSLSRNGANLVFNGVSPNPTGTTSIRNPLRGTGWSTTFLDSCEGWALYHHSGQTAETLGLGISKGLEMAGFPVRGINGVNNSFFGEDATSICAFFHDCDDIELIGGKFEVGHLIASPIDTAAATTRNPLATNPHGSTSNLRFGSYVSGSTDTRLFSPRSIWAPHLQYNPSSRNSSDLLIEALAGQDWLARIAAGETFQVHKSNGSIALYITDSGNVEVRGGLTVGPTGATGSVSSPAGQQLNLRSGTTNLLQLLASGTIAPGAAGANMGTQTLPFGAQYIQQLRIVDGITEPSTLSGFALLYVDSADGDLKIKFGDGTVKTIVTDT